MAGTESQELHPTPNPKDIRKQNQLSEGKTVGWLDLVDVRRATRVSNYWQVHEKRNCNNKGEK